MAREPLTNFQNVLDGFGPGSREKGLAFEQAVRFFLQNDPVWRSILVPESVQLWESSPLRDGPDIGIDLTAVSMDGDNWAIQAKNWDSVANLPKGEVDKFLSASSTPAFHRRLLVTSTDAISANALRAISSQEKPVTIVTRAALEESPAWAGWKGSSAYRRQPERQKELRPHQRAAVRAVTEGFERSDSGQLVMACGTGKTLTSIRIAEQVAPQTVLVLLPSLLLVEQTMKSWLADSQMPIVPLAVCSDGSVGHATSVDAMSTAEMGIPVTTDPDEVGRHLSGSGIRVVFSTYQSSRSVAAALKGLSDTKFDLVIADEAHQLAGVVDRDFGLALDRRALPRQRSLFMTATPRIFESTVKGSARARGATLVSMDDEVFGEVFFNYSFADAIQDAVLTDYRVLVIGIPDTELARMVSDQEIAQVAGIQGDARTLAAHVGIERASQDYKISKMISYHSRVHLAKRFAENHEALFGETRAVSCTVLTGKDPTSRRQRELRKLGEGGAEFSLVTNARCLTEGVDVPTLDAIAFVNPRKSNPDIVQAVGRAIRRGGPEKEFGYVVLPLLVGADGLIEDSTGRAQYRSILDVINALKAHDSALVDRINSARTSLAEDSAEVEISEKIIFDLPKSIDPRVLTNIKVEILRDVAENWFEWFGRLKAIAETNGNAFVRTDYVDQDGFSIGTWVANQRSKHNSGVLPAERAALLETLPGWVWDAKEEWWNVGFSHLLTYVDQYGSARVPQNYLDPLDGFQLGTWLSNRRAAHRRGELDATKVELLEALEGYAIEPEDPWSVAFGHFQEVVAERGSQDIPVSLRCAHGVRVGSWVSNQRTAYKNGRLSQSQVEALERIPGWIWQKALSGEEQWKQNFSRSLRFATDHKRLPSHGKKASINEREVADWVSSQRKRYRLDKLPKEKISLLETIPGWVWSAHDAQWLEKLGAYRLFALENGDVYTPIGTRVDGIDVARFLRSMIKAHDEGRLEDWKRQRLDEIGRWYELNKKRPGRWADRG